jgi:toxin ParE1/3/4
MSQVIRTPQAHLDLIEIGLYIAEDNLEAALEVLDAMEAKFQLLARSPELGRKREELASAFAVPRGSQLPRLL